MRLLGFVLKLQKVTSLFSRHFVPLWLATFTSSCGLPQISAPVIREQLYPGSFPEVWEATLDTLEQQGAIINVADQSSWIITYTTVLGGADLKQAALQEGVDTSQGEAYTTVLIQEKAQNAKVHAYTKIRIQGSALLLGSGGAVERKLFAGLKARLER